MPPEQGYFRGRRPAAGTVTWLWGPCLFSAGLLKDLPFLLKLPFNTGFESLKGDLCCVVGQSG